MSTAGHLIEHAPDAILAPSALEDDAEVARIPVDLVVVGGGMAGMACAAHAAQLGRSVVVLETGPAIGGSARISGGYVWTAPDHETMEREDPGGDPDLARQLVDGWAPGIEWIRELGIRPTDPIEGILGYGRGVNIDMEQFFARCAAVVESHGGHVVTDIDGLSLVTDGGRVRGVRATRGGEAAWWEAPWVALCTGGFQADRELVRDLINPTDAPWLLRSNPHSSGAGIRLGVAAGGALDERTLSGFYGHLFPSPLTSIEEKDFVLLAQFHSERGVLLDRAGRRFVDESIGDHVNNQEVLARPDGVAYLVIDEHVRRTWVLQSYVPGLDVGVDKMALAADHGCRYAQVDSLTELAETLTGWGVDGAAARATVEAYNDALAEGATIDPPRWRHATALTEPPYSVIEVMPGVTFTYGGLRTDTSCRVLDADGAPVPGLLAAGADMGGVFERGYAGGLARGLVFGLAAARTVAEQVPGP